MLFQSYQKKQVTMPKVSVIVPVFNSEQYLKQCVDSILAQSYPDFEVLLIDDGSTDNSSDICDEYDAQDNRIRAIHILNQGVSHARNVGIEIACGQYITFVDSDDYISPNFLASAVNRMESDDQLDFIQFSIERFDAAGPFYIEDSPDATLTLKDFIEYDEFRGSTCISLMKTQIIKSIGLSFNTDLKLGEDQAFLYEYISNCRKCSKVSDICYHYRSNSLSATNNPSPDALVNSILFFKSYKYKDLFAKRIETLLFNLTFQLVILSSMPVKDIYVLCKDIDFSNVSHNDRKLVTFFMMIDSVSRYLAILITRILNAVTKER